MSLHAPLETISAHGDGEIGDAHDTVVIGNGDGDEVGAGIVIFVVQPEIVTPQGQRLRHATVY